MIAPARKSLGQHFLHDPHVIGKLIDEIDPRRDDAMVEIGGGRGALTFPLLERLDRLHVVEIDRELARRLRESNASGTIVLHEADALSFDYASLVSPGARLRVVGNLPYNISTPLLFRLLEYREIIEDMHLMLQKEVVDRMTASPGSKRYGRLTVMLAAWADLESCFEIGPGAFSPPPRVRSALVRVVPRRTPSFTIPDERRFKDIVSHLFSMRRKTIARSLRGRLGADNLREAGFDPSARPENLSPADFARLAALEAEAP